MHNKSILHSLPEFISGREEDAGVTPTTEPTVEQGTSSTTPTTQSQHEDRDDPNVQGLKSALDKERRRADALEKAAKAREKADEERKLAEQSEIDQARTREQKANDKAQRLASGFLNEKLANAITAEAQLLNFIDIDDALKGVDRSKITFSQDEDDPSNVTIDKDTVKAAVKALATTKSHFIKTGTDDGAPTGSAFGGTKKTKPDEEATLRSMYPSLNNPS